MALAPLFNARYVVIDLETTFPRQEISPHEEIIERSHPDETKKLGDGLNDDGVLEIKCPHGLVDIVQEAEEVVHAIGWVVVRGKKFS